jgi:cobalt-zinc-cadmium efflux system protein
VELDPRKALLIALVLSIAILAIELAGGIVFGSTALVADALHVITDILAISFSFVALALSSRPPTGALTYGFHRIEVLASLVNGVSLIAVVGVIMFQAYFRLLSPHPISVLGTVTFGAVALVLNLGSSTILRKAQTRSEHDDINVASAEVHVLGDALASLAVIAGAVAVSVTGIYAFDPIVAIFIGLVVLRGAISITKEGGAIILDRSPIKNIHDLQQQLGGVGGVADVHDLHVWRICSHITVASVHACLDERGKEKPVEVRKSLEARLNTLGMQHVTIQLEDVCCVPSHGHL